MYVDVSFISERLARYLSKFCCTAKYSLYLTLWLPVYKYIVLGNQGKTRDILVDLPTT